MLEFLIMGIDMKIKMDDILYSKNIAELLDKEELSYIATKVLGDYADDKGSMAEWSRQAERILKMASLEYKPTSHPWPGAANINYPIIMTAAMQFHSRTSSALVKNGKIVKPKTVGGDIDGTKTQRGKNVCDYMSWQLLDQPDSDWENSNDKALMLVALIGTIFKKTYYDPIKNKTKSVYVDWKSVFVNNEASELRRVTQIYSMSPQQIRQNEIFGLFLESDMEIMSDDCSDDLHEIVEQHTWLDLDGDGLPEPYIVFVNNTKGNVIRIDKRFNESKISKTDDDKIYNIDELQHFTPFHFIPHPEGKFFSYGYGTLLFASNFSTNMILNNLINAGELYSLNAGFIKDGAIRGDGAKKTQLTPGEYKPLRVSPGSDIQRELMPLPTKEPSNVLLSLVQYLIQGADKLTSVSDVVTGSTDAQYTKPSTVQKLLQQSQAVFTALQKRIFRSYKKEFMTLFELNGYYVPDLLAQQYIEVLDNDSADPELDFSLSGFQVVPVIDPAESDELRTEIRRQELLELLQLPGTNKQVIVNQLVNISSVENKEEILQPDPSQNQPSPEMMKLQQEAQIKQAELQQKEAESLREYELDATRIRAQALKDIAEAEAAEVGQQLEKYKFELDKLIQLKLQEQSTNENKGTQQS